MKAKELSHDTNAVDAKLRELYSYLTVDQMGQVAQAAKENYERIRKVHRDNHKTLVSVTTPQSREMVTGYTTLIENAYKHEMTVLFNMWRELKHKK